jgi:hypothetical protein
MLHWQDFEGTLIWSNTLCLRIVYTRAIHRHEGRKHKQPQAKWSEQIRALLLCLVKYNTIESATWFTLKSKLRNGLSATDITSRRHNAIPVPLFVNGLTHLLQGT